MPVKGRLSRRAGVSKDRFWPGGSSSTNQGNARKRGAEPRHECDTKRKPRAKERQLMTAVGEVAITRLCGEVHLRRRRLVCGRRPQQASRACAYTKTVQKHCCQLGAETSFAATSKHMHTRCWAWTSAPRPCERWSRTEPKDGSLPKEQDTASDQAFQKAAGEVEFTTDAGKVNTREEGWKDLKIAVISKRQAGEPTTPDNWKKQRLPAATMV